MAYLQSGDVVVFPIAKERIDTVEETRLLTEYNVSNLVRQLYNSGQNGFIISSAKDSANNYVIEFNLYGYYFKININPYTIFKDPSSGDGIYVAIKIDTSDEIDGQDEELEVDGIKQNKYTGLLINNIEPTEEYKYIKLFNLNNNNYELNNVSSFSQMLIGGIDGKYK